MSSSFGHQVVAFGAVQLVVRLRWFITLPILTRALGPDGYGLVAALLAIAGLVATFTLSGLNTSVPIYLPRLAPPERARDFRSLLWATALTSLAAGAVITFAHPFLVASVLPEGVGQAALASAMVYVAASTGYALAHARVVSERAGVRFARTVAAFSLVEVGLVVAGALAFGAPGVVLAMAASMGGQTLFIARSLRAADTGGGSAHGRSPLSRLLPYYAYGVGVLGVSAGAWVLESSDRLIIGRMLSTQELGIYYVAYGLGAQSGQLTSAVFAGLMPFLVEAVSAGSVERVQSYLRSALRLLLIVFVPLIALTTFVTPDLLSVLASPEFAEGAVIVPLIVIATAALQLSGLYAYILHAHRRGPLMAISLIAAGLLNVSLNLILIPRYGIVAAAWTTVLGYVTHLLVTRIIAERYVRLPWSWPLLARILAATAPMAIWLWIVQWAIEPIGLRLAADLVVGGLIFGGASLQVGVITTAEVRRFARILGGMARSSPAADGGAS